MATPDIGQQVTCEHRGQHITGRTVGIEDPGHRHRSAVAAVTVLRGYLTDGAPRQNLAPWGGIRGVVQADPFSHRRVRTAGSHRHPRRVARRRWLRGIAALGARWSEGSWKFRTERDGPTRRFRSLCYSFGGFLHPDGKWQDDPV
jgi:hypothetical protein